MSDAESELEGDVETDSRADLDDALQILLVEDNPGDARYIEEMIHEIDTIPERTATPRAATDGDAVDPSRTVALTHETRLADGLDRLDRGAIDVVLLDLNLPDSTGIETVETVREHDDTVPVIVLTGNRDRELGVEALRRGVEEYLVKDEISADILIRSVHHAIERKADRRQLERQRSQLETLNSLNELVHDISHLAIESSTREEVERLVCEHLAEADPYLFAWFGSVDRTHDRVTARAEAGVDGYTESLTLEIGDEDDRRGPTVKAVRTGETQVARNIPENPDYEPWRDRAREYGFQSSAAIPVKYEETVYGVVNLYSARPDAFDDDERTVIGRLGEVVGHAINAIERKRALMSEEVVELRFRLENTFADVDGSVGADEPIPLDRTVPVSEDRFLVYGTATEDSLSALRSIVEDHPSFESLKLLDENGETSRFELQLTEPPVIASVASYGGRVDSAEISDGDFQVVAHFPPSVDVNRILDAVREDFEDIELVAQRQVTRADDGSAHPRSVVTEELTDKQRRALESAYFSGFFAWPRDSSGEDIADSLDISAPTFHQHVRSAEEKLMRSVFEESAGTAPGRTGSDP